MTMNLYTKITGQTKRHALGKLSYGSGVKTPEHVLEYPKVAQNGHKMPTTTRRMVAAK